MTRNLLAAAILAAALPAALWAIPPLVEVAFTAPGLIAKAMHIKEAR